LVHYPHVTSEIFGRCSGYVKTEREKAADLHKPCNNVLELNGKRSNTEFLKLIQTQKSQLRTQNAPHIFYTTMPIKKGDKN
jgi:endonuclease I